MNPFRHTSLPHHSQRTALRLFACSSVLLLTLAGCKTTAVDDATLSKNVQTSLGSDGALTGLGIQGSVQGGVATLTGSAQNDAQRALAARDASGVQGIREVVNNVSIAPVNPAPIAPASADVVTPPPAAIPVPTGNKEESRRERELDRQRQAEERRQQERESRQRLHANPPAPIERAQAQPIPQPENAQPENSQSAPIPRPVPPPQPVFRDITVPAGNAIAVRVTQTLDSTDAQQGQSFSGVVANDVTADGIVAIPAGTRVEGRVDAVQEAAHFKGNSLLTVSLTSMTRHGERLPVASEPYTVEGKGRGKNTAEKTGGGAAVGAILGGIFGGGKGAAIGAVTGGGLGAGSNAITRGQEVQIPSESIVRFRLTQSIPLHVRVDGQNGDRQNLNGQNNASPENSDSSLQHHPQ